MCVNHTLLLPPKLIKETKSDIKMNLKNNILATVIGLSGVCATAQAQMYDDPRMFSFENKQELSYIKTSKSAVELSDAHWRNGKTSLQWTFQPGASLSIKKDLQFEPLDKSGVDNYLSAFIVWVYNEQPQKDKQIRFNFLKDGKQDKVERAARLARLITIGKRFLMEGGGLPV